MVLQELKECGEKLVGISEELAEIFSGSEEKEPVKKKPVAKKKKPEAKESEPVTEVYVPILIICRCCSRGSFCSPLRSRSCRGTSRLFCFG